MGSVPERRRRKDGAAAWERQSSRPRRGILKRDVVVASGGLGSVEEGFAVVFERVVELADGDEEAARAVERDCRADRLGLLRRSEQIRMPCDEPLEHEEQGRFEKRDQIRDG